MPLFAPHTDPHPRDELAITQRRLAGVAELAAALPGLATRQARMVADGSATDPRGSFVGGHPYLPAGSSWPTDAAGTPLVFLVQVNFADLDSVGGLEGYPTSGLLQWFVADDDLYGQTHDGTRQPAHVRYYSAAALAADPAADPADPTPALSAPYASPLDGVTHPTRLRFVVETSMPSVTELSDGYRPDRFGALGDEDLLDELGETHDAHLPDVYSGDDHLPGDDDEDADTVPSIGGGDKVGGWPHIVQGDPRHRGAANEAAGTEAGDTLLIQLDSDHGAFTMWGDGGAGWLFGDPAALTERDTSSLWWAWACH